MPESQTADETTHEPSADELDTRISQRAADETPPVLGDDVEKVLDDAEQKLTQLEGELADPPTAPADQPEPAKAPDAEAPSPEPDAAVDHAGSSLEPEPGPAAAEPRGPSRLRAVLTRACRGPTRAGVKTLVLLDTPFAGLSPGIKNLSGLVGVATFLLAVVVWVIGCVR